MERGRAAGPDPADGARPRKPRRLWRRCVLLLVAVVVAIVTIALLALGTTPGRRAVLGWVSDTIEEVVPHLLPFLLILVATLMIITFFPAITLFLPRLLGFAGG